MIKAWMASDNWIKIEMFLMFIFMIDNFIMSSIIYKLQGLLFTLSTIAIFTSLSKVSGLFVNFFKNIETNKKYLSLIYLGLIELVLLFSYGILEQKLWVILYIIFSIPSSIFLASFFIDYDIMIKNLTSDRLFLELQYLEHIVFSVTAIISGVFVYYTSKYLDIENIVNIVIMIKIVSLSFSIYQYFLNFRHITIKKEDENCKTSKLYMTDTLSKYKIESKKEVGL